MTTNALPPVSRIGVETPPAATSSSDFTDLEVYLALMTRPVEIDASRAERKAASAATRILEALHAHEAQVLCDLGHAPGARRSNQFWLEIERAAASDSPSVRMVARVVTQHLTAHDRALIDNTTPSTPNAGLEALVGEPLDAAVYTLDRTGDLTALMDIISGVEDYLDGPEPA